MNDPQARPMPRDDARPPTPNPPDFRRRPKPECFVCGNYGCHSQLHTRTVSISISEMLQFVNHCAYSICQTVY